jgi:hypothetical protein
MKTFCKLSLISVMALGPMALVGCDETVSKKEETKVNADGSTRTETETVKKGEDGSTKVEKTLEKTPATHPAP